MQKRKNNQSMGTAGEKIFDMLGVEGSAKK